MALPSTPYDSLFQQAGEKHGVDPAILKAIASVESDFRPDAVGPRTRSGQAKGMMQFVPATAKAYGLEDPFNPEQSVDAAARLMKDLLRQFKGDVGNALEAYNGGPRLVGKSKQTAAYRQKVLQRAKLTDSTQLAAKTPPKTAAPTASAPPEPMDRQSLSDLSSLPASYKAALALQYFTDTDPEGNPIETAQEELARLVEEEEYEKEGPAGGTLLARAFSSQQENYVSPFDIMAGMQQPESTDQGPTQVAQVQGFANGGFVFRGTELAARPDWSIGTDYTPEDRARINEMQAQIDAYNNQVADYNKKAQEYQELVKKEEPRYNDYLAYLDDYNKKYNQAVEEYNKMPWDTVRKGAPTAENVDIDFKRYLISKGGTLAVEPRTTYLSYLGMEPGYEKRYRPEDVETVRASFEPRIASATKYLSYLENPNLLTAPAEPNISEYETWLQQKNKEIEPQRKLAQERQLALDVVSNPQAYNLSGFGFKDGGDVNKKGMMARVGQWLQDNDITPSDFLYATGKGFPLGMLLQPSSVNANEEEMLAALRELQAEREAEAGKVVNRSEGSGSRGEEVPRLNASGRVVLPKPTPEEERSLFEQLYGLGEAGLGAVTGMASAIPGSLYGAYKGLTSDKYGTPEGVREADAAAGNVMENLTFMPRSEAGKEYLQEFSQMIPQELMGAMPQSQLMNVRVAPGAVKYLGDRAVEATERGVMPALRAQTQDPNLQPTDVYRAMADTRGTMLSSPRPIYGGLAPVTEGLLKKGEEDTKRRLGDKPSVVYDGVTYAATPRVLSFIEKAEKIKQNLPPVEQGMTRLWRGNRPGEESQNPSFTNSINGIALPFQEAYGGPLTYVDVPTNKLDTYLTGGAPGSEFMLPPELAKKAKIAFTPKQKSEIDRSLLFPSAERPFVGELERRVADLPGPVQKQQFVNSLKGKARDYEIRRVEEALEDFGSTDKLTPNQIMSALKRTSPQRFKLQVLEARDDRKGFARDYDNPYPARPIGSVNLLLEPGEMQKQLNSIVEGIQDFRANKSTNTVFGNDPTYIDEYARGVMELADRVDEFDTQLARSIKQSAEDVASEARPIVDLSLARRYVTTPGLNPKNKWLVNWNDPEKTVPQEVKDLLRARGVTTLTPEVATMAAKEIATVDYLKELKKTINSGNPYATLVRNTLSGYERDMLDALSDSPNAFSKATIGLDDFYRAASDPNQAGYTAERMQDFAAEVNGVLRDFDTVLNFGKNEVIKDLRNLTQGMLESDTLLSGKIYEGKHPEIVSQNPISFSRFVEVDPLDIANPPEGMQPGQGLLFTELQSDRRSAIQNMRKGLVEEPYPGFAQDPDTLSELMMKSAVAGAAQLNKKLVLFPGADSKQPQLYGTWATKEAKELKDMSQYSPSIMKRISKKVAKDLGEGYEAREFKTINGAGNEVIRWGIVLPDDASNLPQKGIRFAKGGLVDKPTYNRA